MTHAIGVAMLQASTVLYPVRQWFPTWGNPLGGNLDILGGIWILKNYALC